MFIYMTRTFRQPSIMHILSKTYQAFIRNADFSYPERQEQIDITTM
jgi:hypothetical protein